MKTFSEGVASRYGIKEAVIAQYLWNTGENYHEDAIMNCFSGKQCPARRNIRS